MRRMLQLAHRATASPGRSPRSAVVLGRLLGAAFVLCFATGMFSHFHQSPLPWMVFPTRPIWIYQFTQGLHVIAGIACIPLLLGKLWAVFPNLFQWPAVRSVPHFLERASIAVFVAASLVEIAIGLVNTYQWYVFPFSFRSVHYALAWVIIGSLALHIAVQLPVIRRHWTRRGSEAADPAEADAPQAPAVATAAGSARVTEPAGVTAHARGLAGVTGRVVDWIDAAPQASPRLARRSVIGAVLAATAVVVVTTAGQTVRVLDPVNVFAPRKKDIGPNGLPVNRSSRQARITPEMVGDAWRLTVVGASSRAFSLDELRALPQTTVELPIACVEGWSQTATWTGVRLRELAALVGSPAESGWDIRSLEPRGSFRRTTMGPEFAADPLTLVALRVNGDELDLEHGYPARMIAPARPGVLQTKWLTRLEVLA